MRLIDADALIMAFERIPIFMNAKDKYRISIRLPDMFKVIKHQPTIEPERQKGEWLPDNNNYYEERFICSVCGRSYKVDTCMGKPMWGFCPNCGADMRGEKNGN